MPRCVMSGLFVTFEGIDGCGKSTQVAEAHRRCKELGIRCLVTREPGGTGIGESIRRLLLSPDNREMCDPCEALLYCAARAQHCRESIAPALARGEVVLCDRFQEATFAYQGFGRGIALEQLSQINSFASAGVRPSLTFVFDIDVDTSIARLKKTGKNPDRLEASGRDFYEKVRQGYLLLASREPDRIIVLPGIAPVEQLAQTVFEKIENLLSKRPKTPPTGQ
jgi:dTMP kinase